MRMQDITLLYVRGQEKQWCRCVRAGLLVCTDGLRHVAGGKGCTHAHISQGSSFTVLRFVPAFCHVLGLCNSWDVITMRCL